MWQLEIHTWGRDERRAGQRPLHVARRRRDVEAADGPRPADAAGRQGRGRRSRASNPNRVYALIETGDGVPWNGQGDRRAASCGAPTTAATPGRWSATTATPWAAPHYYSRMAVAPDNENEAYFLTASFSKSIDGGATLDRADRRAEAPGGDHHDIWIDPTNAQPHDRRATTRACRSRSTAAGPGFRQRLPNAQMYHVTVDNEIPYNVLRQQAGRARRTAGRATAGCRAGRRRRGIPRAMWHAVGGGESGWATPDPADPNIIWSSASGSGRVGGIVVALRREPPAVPQRRGVARPVERAGRPI